MEEELNHLLMLFPRFLAAALTCFLSGIGNEAQAFDMKCPHLEGVAMRSIFLSLALQGYYPLNQLVCV